MELLLGLLFTLALLLCAAPLFVLFSALFCLVPLPAWLEQVMIFVFSLAGGFWGQAAILDLFGGARSWRQFRDGGAGLVAIAIGHLLIGTFGGLAMWGGAALMGAATWLQQVAAGAGFIVVTLAWCYRTPGLIAYIFPRRTPQTLAWEIGAALLATACLFAPPALSRLSRKGEFAGTARSIGRTSRSSVSVPSLRWGSVSV